MAQKKHRRVPDKKSKNRKQVILEKKTCSTNYFKIVFKRFKTLFQKLRRRFKQMPVVNFICIFTFDQIKEHFWDVIDFICQLFS